MRMFYTFLPIAGVVGAVLIMKNYDITEAKGRRDQSPADGATKSRQRINRRLENRSCHTARKKSSLSPGLKSTRSISWRCRKQCANLLDHQMHGICFSPYEGEQEPGDPISEEQVRRKLALLQPHTRWVRVFSCTEGNDMIPQLAREYGFKTLVGAWLGEDKRKKRGRGRALDRIGPRRVRRCCSCGQ